MRTHTTLQLIKFSLTGVINTAVDFAVLNLLIAIFGLVSGGPRFIVFKTISAAVAIVNSYFLNKYWVFKITKEGQAAVVPQEAGKFIAVSLVGLVINALVAAGVFALTHPLLPNISTQLQANGSALVAIVIVMITNFIGYKFLVFKR